MTAQEGNSKKSRRVLGDEWIDWDGSIEESLVNTQKKLFLWVSVLGVFATIAAVFLFTWLIHPRLIELSPVAGEIVIYIVFAFAALLVLWVCLFIISLLFELRLLAPILLVPRVINFMLNMAVKIGGLLGIPRDRMVNSFLKVHNLVLRLKDIHLDPQELLV
ncbi:MAG TPA: hypothetical protein ENO22_14820, partial [candidate division Zixibacteria bacterium]|nr:hypothetical protein [candidate division Zixibacteria bacterium]